MKILLGCVFLVSCAGVVNAQPVEWLDARSGFWDDAGNWSTGSVPSGVDIATLGLHEAYTVLMRQDQAVSHLNLTNPDAQLDLLGGTSLTFENGVQNHGVIRVNPKLSLSPSRLVFTQNASVLGSGVIRLHGQADGASRVEVQDGSVLTIGSEQVIEGGGLFEGGFFNQGRIATALGGDEIRFGAGSALTNQGSIGASSAGTVYFDDVDVVQIGEGLIEAIGPGSKIVLDQAVIDGGVVRTAGDGRIVLFTQSNSIRNALIVDRIEIETEMSVLSISNSVIEDAAFVVRSQQLVGNSVLLNNGTRLVGVGGVRLESDSTSRAALSVGDDVIIEGAYELSGYGLLSGSFVNRAGIVARDTGKELRLFEFLSNPGITSTAPIQAVDGARLTLGTRIMQQQGSAILSSGDGSVVRFERLSVLHGGSVATHAGGTVESELGVRFVDVVLNGHLVGGVNFAGASVNNGEIHGSVQVEAPYLLSGTGVVELMGSIRRISSVPGSLMHGADHSIVGSGVVIGSFENEGVVSADVSGEEIEFTGDVVNNSTMQAVGGGKLVIRANVAQGDGGVFQAVGPGSVIEFQKGPVSLLERFVGGELRTSNGGKVCVCTLASFQSVRAYADLVVEREGLLLIGEDVELRGLIEVVEGSSQPLTGTVSFLDGDLLDAECTIRLSDPNGYAVLTSGAPQNTLRMGTDVRVEGIGKIRVAVEVHGTVSPGIPVGELVAESNLTLMSSSRTELMVGLMAHGKIVGESEITLGGQLELSMAEGFEPSGYWARVAVESPKIDGIFEEIVAPDAPTGFVTRVYSTGTELLVGQTCLADITLDGAVDFFDVSEFIRLYQEGWSGVDLNGDGALNFFDVTAFIVGYQQGCP